MSPWAIAKGLGIPCRICPKRDSSVAEFILSEAEVLPQNDRCVMGLPSVAFIPKSSLTSASPPEPDYQDGNPDPAKNANPDKPGSYASPEGSQTAHRRLEGIRGIPSLSQLLSLL